jgi:hypothetical protein
MSQSHLKAQRLYPVDRAKLYRWLSVSSSTQSTDGKYRHRLVREDLTEREQFFEELKNYFKAAHKDAQDFFKTELLDPLGIQPSTSPIKYPQDLPVCVLQGYFGEILSGLFMENFSPFEADEWVVPAYLFRFHNVIFERLEVALQGGDVADQLPGRTGDDCLAFKFDDQLCVEQVLYCEAKCTSDHDSELISDAHEKVSKDLPACIHQIVAILKTKADSVSANLVKSLNTFREKVYLNSRGKLNLPADYRCDLVSYACSRSPVRKGSGELVKTCRLFCGTILRSRPRITRVIGHVR